jgi:hypothetical protein
MNNSPADETDALTQVEPPPLAFELSSQKRQKSFYRWRSMAQISVVVVTGGVIASIISGLLLLNEMVDVLVGRNGPPYPAHQLAPYLITLLVINGLIWPIRGIVLDSFRAGTASLAGTYDITAIGALLDAREVKDNKTVVLATNGLITLLPHVREGDIVLLNWRQRALLRSLLYSENKLLVVAALNALEYIGDREALWYVAALKGKTSHSFTFPSAAIQEVQEAANACYQAIKSRIALGHVRATLLRPSMVNSQGAELLRPAVIADTPPEQLLRSSNADYEG